jgi:type II secretion system protein H
MNARGFTLAELMVVLAITGALATLVAPTLLSYARTAALQAAARELATSINLARQIAISRNTTVCVELAAPAYLRLKTGGCSGPVWTGAGTDGSGAIKISDSAFHVTTTANVVFTSLGAASPAGTYTVTNPVSNGTRTVVVAATGRVSVR